jgi:hypothetical protein
LVPQLMSEEAYREEVREICERYDERRRRRTEV